MKKMKFNILVLVMSLCVGLFSMTMLIDVAYAHGSDSNYMTDEMFLGVWDNGTQSWSITPKINYDYNNDIKLNDIRNYVKGGDYVNARIELLSYFQSRQIILVQLS